jgi:hypothetical protein
MGIAWSQDHLGHHNHQDTSSFIHPLMVRDINGAGYNSAETRQYQYVVYHNGACYGMVALASFLLVFCSLLAGLTLAICGLDMTLLQLRCVTGPAKQRYMLRLLVCSSAC